MVAVYRLIKTLHGLRFTDFLEPATKCMYTIVELEEKIFFFISNMKVLLILTAEFNRQMH